MTTSTPVPALDAMPEDHFATYYGYRAIEIGEEGERLLVLGHPTDRMALAVTLAHHRELGHRLLTRDPGGFLRQARRTWATAHTAEEEGSWYVEECELDTPHAQPVTFLDNEWFDWQDAAVPEECPVCGRLSRSTSFAWALGNRAGSLHHTCRRCEHRWPAAPLYRVSLWKGPRRAPRPPEPGTCYGCQCTTWYQCAPGCTAAQPDPIVGRPQCSTCRARHTPQIWRELVAAGYGTDHPHPHSSPSSATCG